MVVICTEFALSSLSYKILSNSIFKDRFNLLREKEERYKSIESGREIENFQLAL